MTQNKTPVDTPNAVKSLDEADERIKKLDKERLRRNTREAKQKRGYS